MRAGARPHLVPPGMAPDFSKAPITVAWEITRACPLKCLHCRADAQHRRDPGELTTEEGVDLINQAAEMGVKVFVITGGDPLARPDVWELIAASAASGMHTGFSPSVTPRLTEEALARAVESGAASIHLSLDGARAETHDGFRGVKGAFDRTLEAIDRITRLDARMQIGTSVNRRTLGDLHDIVPLLDGKVDLWSVFFHVPTGRGDLADLLTPEEHEEVLTWLATTEFPFPVRTTAAPAFRRVLVQTGQPPGPGVNDGNGFCFVSHVGEVCPSGFLQLPAGTVREASLAHWYRDSELFRSLRDPELLEGKCGRCNFKTLCGGSRARAWAMTGDPLASDPTCAYEPPAA